MQTKPLPGDGIFILAAGIGNLPEWQTAETGQLFCHKGGIELGFLKLDIDMLSLSGKRITKLFGYFKVFNLLLQQPAGDRLIVEVLPVLRV